MVLPVGAETFCRSAMGSGFILFERLSKAGHNTNIGDEGGFAPDLGGTRDALDFVVGRLRRDLGLAKMSVAIDAASANSSKTAIIILRAR